MATRNITMSRQKKLDEWKSLSGGRWSQNQIWLQDWYGRYILRPNLALVTTVRCKDIMSWRNGTRPKGHRRCRWYRKATLLKSLLGIIKPLNGKVTRGDYIDLGYFEQENAKRKPWIAKKSGYLHQDTTREAVQRNRCGLTSKHIESPKCKY